MDLRRTVRAVHRTLLLIAMLFKWGMSYSEMSSKCWSLPCQNGGTCVDAEDDYICLCSRAPPLYMGKDCDRLFDDCPSPPCANCTGAESHACVCPPGLTGADCSVDMDDCESAPCRPPRSRCVDRLAGYTCHCPRGWGGADCSSPVEECSDQPCLHGASCLQVPDGFQCVCAPGFRGERCEEDVDECWSGPCQNGALCLDGVGTHRCFCVPGFQGYNCEIDINECASRPCRNNGTCVNEKDRYLCQCMLGYAGVNCELEIDECASRPCQNGATCHDHLGLYTCDCHPGYEGLDCEIDVDECESSPCLNRGTCIDQVDSYKCDCGGTGFAGARCEENIPECASNPCQHNSTCLDGVNLYTCQCWPGYEGERCEVDLDECALEPCENGAECIQRSDQRYRQLQPDGWEFSYADAAGYQCLCLAGFTGENCSVDTDECESDPCQNQASCVDLIDGYACECQPGFSGPECQVDIDECENQPCQNGASCEDSMAGYSCLCPEPEPGGVAWGGHDCHIQLLGCTEHQCQNGATCVPLLRPDGEHSYSCRCPVGFHGDHCSVPTTFSFSTPEFVLIDVTPANGTRKDLGSAVMLRFRTTLPDVVMLYLGDVRDYLSLEIVTGDLLARAAVGGAERLEAVLPGPVNDGQWHEARVDLGAGLWLRLTSSNCSREPCVAELHKAPWRLFSIPPSFSSVSLGGAPPELLVNTASNGGFMGCMEDLRIDSQTVLPQNIPPDRSHGLEVGCSWTQWCHSDPCLGHGRCIDMWATFNCDCYSPYHGDNCSEEYSPWTFSHEGSLSYASYDVRSNHGTWLSVLLLLRSRKQAGLVLQLQREGGAYLTIYLRDGQLHVSVPPAPPTVAKVTITTGEWQLLTVDFLHDRVFLNHANSLYFLGSVPTVWAEAGDVAYIGGLPQGHGVEAWGGHFKGCLWDVRLDRTRLEVDTWNGTLDSAPRDTYFPRDVVNVEPGCTSDNSCQGVLCRNNGLCLVTWNDFVCSCNENFTGKTCETRLWCAGMPCATGSRCVDMADGYECLTEATFENNALQYSSGGSLVSPVTDISMELRTRAQDALLLQASNGTQLFRLGLQNGSLAVEMHSRDSVQPLSFASKTPVADGDWHHVQLAMADPRYTASPWVITVDRQNDTGSPGVSGSLDFLNDSIVYLADSFVGCLREVRVGGVYLPFMDVLEVPQRSRFLRHGGRDAQAGCSGPPVCLSQPCLNSGTCEDRFGLFYCVCAPGWEGQYCQDNMDDCASRPCIHGTCHDLLADFECRCPPGYGGKICEKDLDDCEGHVCKNGGTCLDRANSYTCICPPDFRGPLCEWSYPPVQCDTDVICVHGECNDGLWGANCTCSPGYTGERCKTEIDECQSNPCQHGGSCLDQLNKFLCVCVPGFVGPHCETSKQEQKDRIPWLVVAIPLACCCLLLAAIGLTLAVLTARKKRQSEGAYSPSQQEVAGARLEMDSVLKVPPEERLI
ncbi:protein crumbs homolog 2-like [Brienomyrus brachyistius]|uniref:protein crumbs homolog 2-like n=1 Tax=Brienomyrus brachyistius TaxID=42636 RepID=UPI0020B1E3F7|nr:protein crumbs homolog 2-like [Brienomyrus brachyistius]